MRFADRREAGRQLADEVARHERVRGATDVVVLGLPRGGVPVAREVADRLGAPLDVLVVRKLGAPGHEELAIGAIGEGDTVVLDEDRARRLGVSPDYLDDVTARERVELRRRVARYRRGEPALPVAGRTVVLVDDGIATGSTVAAAIGVLTGAGAGEIIVAVPVASAEALRVLSASVAAVIVVHVPRELLAVGSHYIDFSATSDDEVVAALAADRPDATSQARRPHPG